MSSPFIRALYERTMAWAGHRHAPWGLALVSGSESVFFPIPPDLLLIPMALANRARAFFFAAICTIASVLGGLVGYLIGWALFETVGVPLLTLYGYQDAFERFAGLYDEWGWLIVFAAGFTPIPYKVFTLASGLAGMNIIVFMIASTLSRGARFFLVAGLIYAFGPSIRAFLERRLGWLTAAVCAAGVAGVLAIKLLL